jgi:3-phenylpropionate/trans-cinnamate dioxygenase ferredoxin subunit
LSASGFTKVGAGPPGPGEVGVFDFEGEPVAVWNIGGQFYALADTCTHEYASLAGGEVDPEELTVECPKHTSRFDLRTGSVLGLPAVRDEERFEVRVEGDEVFLACAALAERASN